MPVAVIVDAVRTPVGRRNGRLKDWHPVDLASEPLKALVARNDLDPALVEDVVMGCTMTVGEQAMNIGRNAALAAGFPDSVPGTTVDRQCGSAQQAVHFAAQAVISGAMDIVIGAGIESMTRVPIGSTTEPGPGEAYGPRVLGRYAFVHQGLSAEMIADKWGISREEMDHYALGSHEKAARAIGQQVHMLHASNEREIDAAFATITQMRMGALIVGADPFFVTRREQLVAVRLDDDHGCAAVAGAKRRRQPRGA